MLPNLPVAIQANWSQSSAADRWDQPNANVLCDYWGEPMLLDLSVRRGIYYPLASADTAIIQCRDPGWDIVREKPDSVLWPSPLLGVPVRILHQSTLGSGDWRPVFFGYIAQIAPDPRDVPRSLSWVTVTVESPLRWVGAKNVTPTFTPGGVPIWQTGYDGTALQHLLEAGNLWSGALDLAYTPVGVPLPADFGGQPVQLAQALVDLVFLMDAAVRAVPLMATGPGEPDWGFKLWYPQIEDGILHLQPSLGDLDAQPSIQWREEAY